MERTVIFESIGHTMETNLVPFLCALDIETMISRIRDNDCFVDNECFIFKPETVNNNI